MPSIEFGLISDPKIPLDVRTVAGYVTHRFLIDTGADFSLAPRALAAEVGLQWAALPESRVIGVEQGSVLARLGELPIRVKESELNVRCLFLEASLGLLILGRADFLDRFVLTIDQGRGRIVLTEVAEVA